MTVPSRSSQIIFFTHHMPIAIGMGFYLMHLVIQQWKHSCRFCVWWKLLIPRAIDNKKGWSLCR